MKNPVFITLSDSFLQIIRAEEEEEDYLYIYLLFILIIIFLFKTFRSYFTKKLMFLFSLIKCLPVIEKFFDFRGNL